MKNREKIIELNKKALELDSQIDAIREQLTEAITDDFDNENIETLTNIANLLTADCVSYYRYRIRTKIYELENK